MAELHQLKEANPRIIQAEALWLPWLEMVNDRHASISIIPDCILPHVATAVEDNQIPVEIVEEIAQYEASKLRLLRAEMNSYQDTLEQ
ncbi:hypothetical protein RCL1_007417 [Eukaryota sp. TZLM3-RCL]